MFFTNYDTYEGRPPTIFRAPEDIKRDLFNIREKISQTNERLNLHSTLMELVARMSEGDAEDWISDLKYITLEAEESLEQLGLLKEQLEDLTLELEETLCVIGRKK